jgi:hypothetical protein
MRMMKSYTYRAQGIIDFMGIAKSVFPAQIFWMQDAGKNTQP